MGLTANQKLLMQELFREINLQPLQVTTLFYNHLFESFPEVKQLFNANMENQGYKFVQMMSMIVNALERPERYKPLVQGIAQKHLEFGVKKEDYAKVRAALTWALEQAMGDRFNTETREAWEATF